MRSCFMFGHGDCPDRILSRLEDALEQAYLQDNVRMFYVGNRGNFDRLATIAAKRLKKRYSDLHLCLLLAYHPVERNIDLSEGFDNSFYPPLENVPRKYAIVKANQYMAETVDIIVCYVAHFGNARNLLDYVKNNAAAKKRVNIAENPLGYEAAPRD